MVLQWPIGRTRRLWHTNDSYCEKRNTCQPSVRSVEIMRLIGFGHFPPSPGQSRRVAGQNKNIFHGGATPACFVFAGGCTAADHQQLRQDKTREGKKLTLAHPRNDTAADEDHTHLDDLERRGFAAGRISWVWRNWQRVWWEFWWGRNFCLRRAAKNGGSRAGARDFEIWLGSRSGGGWGVHL